MTATPPAPEFTAPGPAPKKKPHVLSIIALIVAVIGFIFACVPGALIVGWILLPIAFVLSLVALFLKGSKWPAITGLLLAIVGTIVGFVVFFALVANAATEAFGTETTSSQSSTGSGTEEAATAAKEDTESDYTVTIDDATQAKDYEGKPVLVVDFTFTNNSDEAANFMFAVSTKAFQDGVELDDAILTDDAYDSSSATRDIKPGKSIPVQWAYNLDGKNDVTIEVSDLLSFDDAPTVTKTFTVK
ncbi:DUF5067 domain-containing protein [Microbacterium horticulturae]|uniref:DUF5067 domain-containing protein n=1 Tax=Microbacterium horticulturae TaxID=3028316 RepID=A0ABY8BUZ9_9MICO|nr:DUF5067 domain-containing protein [Microbacterium sp. KACC 23027]WEG07715.1 DUF5067 domain-containing protein [Microbacterium sp. KACC 23027]